MRRVLLLLAIVAALASVAQADLIGYNCDDDGDGVISMNPVESEWLDLGPNGEGISQYRLNLFCQQHEFAAGHIEGDFTADPEDPDPIVYLVQSVDNYTDFIWTDYHITVGMDKPFTIISVMAPGDWTYSPIPPISSVAGPLPSHENPGDGQIANVDFYAGTPIEPGQSGIFGVVLQFTGSVNFCTEQYPTPEPATLGMLGLGALVLRRKRR